MNKNILMKQLQLLIEKNTSMCELQFWYRRYYKWCYAYWKDVKSGLRYFCTWNNFLIFSTKYMLGTLFKFQCNTVIAAPWIGKTFAKFLVLLRPCIFVSNILMKTVLFFLSNAHNVNRPKRCEDFTKVCFDCNKQNELQKPKIE